MSGKPAGQSVDSITRDTVSDLRVCVGAIVRAHAA